MDLKTINDILTVVSVSGINQIVLSVKDDNKVLVSGIDKDGTVVAFHMFDNNGMLDKSLGIHRISVLMDRLKLFNLSKTVVEQVDKNYFTKSILLKEGRKKISYMVSEPTMINAPKEIVPDDIIGTLSIDKTMFESLYSASQTINSTSFYLVAENDEIVFTVLDDTSGDKYEEVIGSNNAGHDYSYKWNVEKFFKLIRQNLKTKDTTQINIGKHGYLSLNITGIDFLLLPLFTE